MQETNKIEELERRLREAEERIASEKQRAEKEQQRAEEAERERQQERDRAEKEQQRAEKEQQRAEKAERERQQERDRAEKEQQRAEKEQQRAEKEQQRAEKEQQRAEKEQQRAEEAEEQTRPTTFDEYIAACHHHVFSQFTVERDRRLTSRGSITNPRNKLCPTSLEPWPRFLELQGSVFNTLYECLPVDIRVFESQNFLAGLGRRVAQRPIADEKTLEYFMHNSVEDPVRVIMEQLRQIDEVCDAFDMGNGIVFENHPHAISDVAEEVVARGNPSTPPQTPDHRRDLHRLRPDQICIYRSGDDPSPEKRTMIYVSEYKAPHKLTAPHLRAGLRPMNIYKEVVNRKTIPPSMDPDGRFQYHAERLTASALTQTYHYMIEGGLEYGLLTTGEATVFLKVDWAEPETLYYHLAEPGPEVLAHPEHMQSSSAVGQYLAFSLMALAGHLRHTRTLTGRRLRDEISRNHRTTSRDIGLRIRRAPLSGKEDMDNADNVDEAMQMYLDEVNESWHADHAKGLLRQTLDAGITKLGKHGARGVLFKVTLLSYGYTFVCKGTVQAFIRDLEHEAAVYKRLEQVQGVNVPVFLGAVDLRPLKRTYYYDHRVYVVHMTFLSWGGDMIDEAKVAGSTRRILEAKALASLRAIHQEGVVHKDVRSANMLINKETDGVMMIDFERAILLEPVRWPLAQLVPNKRRLDSGNTTGSGKGRACKRRGAGSCGFAEDTLMVRTAFLGMEDGQE
ncbi:kinase [Hirsutella rhossiliensis]|uniref:EKC/KEOPS complex subunit BUD32 n=1 Tax=Hirsutella rhossiliensis TaxID=111463 RepID=A0A9P8SEZ0_9HYPO|nr:kinase [Hirsutella rhossiliensis]KAH0958506.1 kinase [Hirsutella rhossiliensis]